MPALIARVGTDKYTVGNRRAITLRSAVAQYEASGAGPQLRRDRFAGKARCAPPRLTPGLSRCQAVSLRLALLREMATAASGPRRRPIAIRFASAWCTLICAEHERVVLASNVYGCQRCRHGTVHTRHYETRDAQTPTKKM